MEADPRDRFLQHPGTGRRQRQAGARRPRRGGHPPESAARPGSERGRSAAGFRAHAGRAGRRIPRLRPAHHPGRRQAHLPGDERSDQAEAGGNAYVPHGDRLPALPTLAAPPSSCRPDADHRPILRPVVWPALAPGIYDIGDVFAVWDCGDVEDEEGGDEGGVGEDREAGEEVGFRIYFQMTIFA
jgi:hypothetical protein